MLKKKKNKKPTDIENQSILAETYGPGYKMIRLTRVKDSKNPNTLIDLRLFQRGSDDDGEDVYYPTKKGVQIKEEQFQRLIGKWTLVPTLLFHPLIIKKSYPSLKREEFDTAVFQAFKAVEVRVRKASGLPASHVGTALMRKAFDIESGLLTDNSAPKAEREGMAHLFAGAISCYKNPHSHRDVELTFNEAFEMLLVASHLLRILERLNKGNKT
ncbi:TIGR02391 family protein [bacterium]|nr:TIGR02391 family protein [bacterium]